MNTPDDSERFRLDTWLWAARFYKTRALAQEAIQGGKVHVNGQRAKPGRAIQVGERLSVHKEPELFEITVRGLAHQRGPATVAVTLYEESEESRQAREQGRLQRREQAQVFATPGGRPTKKARRDMHHRWGE